MDRSGYLAYADCFSGISGDMLLGALIHAGLDENLLKHELAKLELPDAQLETEHTSCQSIGCIKVKISEMRRQELRTLPQIRYILTHADLAPAIKERSLAVFGALAEAEAKVHNIPVNKVHFHEIGALDTIFDVVGTVIGLHHLGISRLIASPLPLGGGFVKCAHGLIPLPAPATCELLKGIPTYGVDVQAELVTPTGAALIKVLADDFGPLPPMTIAATGYGSGTQVLPNDQPNLLRLVIGTSHAAAEAQTVTVLETRLDDWSPESFPHLCDLLLARGALDVSLTGCQGKKGRPGFHLQVICKTAESIQLQDLILSETTAIGLRMRQDSRRTLPRKPVQVDTPWGVITAKMVTTPRGDVIYPEYEECRKIALEHACSLDEVYRAVYSAKGNME
ncbi:nickel pincer cofactor biosynthesis protein LarC [Desulfopila aestuarii]|uniref:Putative nickel insertion protein n=1 Tax=Desulfopila aestuarii DSM 18488 TaxID=1121416 RepID=A0A1M7Y9W3_9BACT|nr:nickel pincer cofactor biosynthesis protein LarC [Desulfopila aestuarii]SHO49424.1 hypothetical protein SAMN02745220_02850 [Desulfopila aestuarii DSM 18488]